MAKIKVNVEETEVKEVKLIDASNPFNDGVNYEMFLNELGNKNIDEFLKGKCTAEQIEWLKEDLKHYKPKK